MTNGSNPNITPKDIHPIKEGLKLIPDASPGHHETTSGRWGNVYANARAPFNVKGPLEVRWTSNLSTNFYADKIQHTKERIVVTGSSQWALLDKNGRLIACENFSTGDINLDEKSGVFIGKQQNGALCAWNLEDGKIAYIFSAFFGAEMDRILIHRMGGRILIVSSERQTSPHDQPQPSNLTEAELREIDTEHFAQRNAVKFITSAPQIKTLPWDSSTASAVFDGERLVVAIPNELTITDASLKVVSILKGKFVPVSLSLDEGGRMYLLVTVDSHEEHQGQLWVLDPDGGQLGMADVEDDVIMAANPPGVGYDHRIYLKSEQRIVALEKDGRKAWEFSTGHVGGYVPTPDGAVLATADHRIIRLNRDGTYETLAECPAPLVTAPIIFDSGILVAASNDKVFGLVRK